MPLITETYYLSLTQDNRGILRLRCSQDDTLRTVNLKLYNNGSIFVIPSGVSASVSGVKQNGAVFSKPCTISQNRESVVLQLSSDITNVDGIIVAEVVLNDGEGGRLGTSNFIIQVEKNPIRAGVVQDTETPIEYINDFITQIQALTARLNNLITPSGDPSLAEVVDARISSLDNNTYQNLKARIDADIAALNTGKANKANVYTKSQVDDLLENVEIDVDDELSDESENPVQNKVINGAISELKADLANAGLSDAAKTALLACFRHIALWTEGTGEQYINVLESALNNDVYPQIRATFNAGANVIYTDDTLASLKQYLTVKYYETAQSTGTVISASNYTVSGVLTEGTSLITVAYNNVSTVVSISNVVDFYNQYEWSISAGNVASVHATGSIDNNTGALWINVSNAGVNAKRRRIFAASRGKKAYIDYYTKDDLQYYPIPVPPGATKYTISSEANTYYLGSVCYVYDESTQKYSQADRAIIVYDSAGARSVEFTPIQNAFLLITAKADSAGTSEFADTEPVNMTVIFE